MFTYISNGAGSAPQSTSSLTLQQHMSHHYRALEGAQPQVDTGQARRAKGPGRRRWRRPADSPENSSGVRSAKDQRLLEAILRDERLPPQCYMRRDSEDLGTSGSDAASLSVDPATRGAGVGAAPATEAILGKIDRYLDQVRAKKQSRHVSYDLHKRPQSSEPSLGPQRPAGRRAACGAP
ncbi:uncharacterized protein LOC119093866, partial [Pollicipes pollicipes]|uniref:uncharacterized protein LOC119093866 n=1 Tax=Pollicipes pollicipes TaxID=41117 RepID=UPI0018851EED